MTREILEQDELLNGLQQTLEITSSAQNLHLTYETDLGALYNQLRSLKGLRTDALNDLQECGAISAYEHYKEMIS